MTAERLISVVVPAHNHAGVIREALDSVWRQGYRPLEAIVVDDGSIDAVARRVMEIDAPVRVIRQARRGASSARNRGLSEARGGLIAFLDADDRMTPRRLQRQAAELRRQPDLDAVFGDVVEFRQGSGGGRSAPRPARLLGSLLLRRRALDAVGPFAEDLMTGEFIDWLARAEAAGVRLGYLPGVVLERRLHAGSHGHAADLGAYARVLKTVLDRRRGSASAPRPFSPDADAGSR